MNTFICPSCHCTSEEPVIIIDEERVIKNKKREEDYKKDAERVGEKQTEYRIKNEYWKSLPKKAKEIVPAPTHEWWDYPLHFCSLPTKKIICPVCNQPHYFFGGKDETTVSD